MLAVGREGGEPDSPGWIARVVPNLYPAFERQEVVAHSPRHVRTFAELDDAEVDAVAAAWLAREQAAAAEGFAYVHLLVNEGRAAGASLAHSHSQIVWMRERPPLVAGEDERRAGVAGVLEDESLAVVRGRDAVAVVHPAGRLPYETLIAAPGGELDVADALRVLREVVRRLRAVEGPLPWNAWLHRTGHPHLELVPRLSTLAGVELGAGIYVNTVAPEDAAATLRNAA